MMIKISSMAVALAMLLSCASLGIAAPPAAPIDAASKAVLERMCTFLASTKAFTVHVDTAAEEVLQSGVKVQRHASGDVKIQRPNMLHATIDGDLIDRSFWYDGQSFAIFLPSQAIYSLAAAPPTLDACMDWVVAKTGFSFPLLDYVYSDPLPGLIEGVRLTHNLGLSKVDGVDCTHLAFKQSTINWQVWIENSATPVPRKIVVDYKAEPGAPQYIAVLSGWKFPEALPAGNFKFTPPAGTSQVPLLQRVEEVK